MIDPNKLDIDGCIRFACKIAENRGKKYRSAYADWLNCPTNATLGNVKFWEAKLKSPPTCLGDSEIKRIQKQVEVHHNYHNY